MRRKWMIVNPNWGYYAGTPDQGVARWTPYIEFAYLFDKQKYAEHTAKGWAKGLVLLQPVCEEDIGREGHE